MGCEMEEIIRILRAKTENDCYMRYDYESLKKIILDECPDIGDVDKTIFELEQQLFIHLMYFLVLLDLLLREVY